MTERRSLKSCTDKIRWVGGAMVEVPRIVNLGDGGIAEIIF